MLRIIALLYGVGFIFAGVAGFLPNFMVDGLLLGYFEVNTMHNIVHLITGVIAILAVTRYSHTKLFFQVFGILYTLVAILGFWWQGDLMIMQVNMADNIFHLVVGIISLYLGFVVARRAHS